MTKRKRKEWALVFTEEGPFSCTFKFISYLQVQRCTSEIITGQMCSCINRINPHWAHLTTIYPTIRTTSPHMFITSSIDWANERMKDVPKIFMYASILLIYIFSQVKGKNVGDRLSFSTSRYSKLCPSVCRRS